MPADGRLMIDGDRVGGYWPLPDGRCRFSFPIGSAEEHRPDAAHLDELLAAFAPWFRGDVGDIEWTAVGLFERKLAASFGAGANLDGGDAAHLTGPLGGQSMNVGLREADDLAERLVRMVRPGPRQASRRLQRIRARRSGATCSALRTSHGSRRSLLLPCLPASGADLKALIGSTELSRAAPSTSITANSRRRAATRRSSAPQLPCAARSAAPGSRTRSRAPAASCRR